MQIANIMHEEQWERNFNKVPGCKEKLPGYGACEGGGDFCNLYTSFWWLQKWALEMYMKSSEKGGHIRNSGFTMFLGLQEAFLNPYHIAYLLF